MVIIEAVRFHCFTGLQRGIGGVNADEGEEEGVMWEEPVKEDSKRGAKELPGGGEAQLKCEANA